MAAILSFCHLGNSTGFLKRATVGAELSCNGGNNLEGLQLPILTSKDRYIQCPGLYLIQLVGVSVIHKEVKSSPLIRLGLKCYQYQ